MAGKTRRPKKAVDALAVATSTAAPRGFDSTSVTSEAAPHSAHSFEQLDAPADCEPPSVSTVQLKERENRTGLPDDLKSGLENLSGIDLSGVRVHRNSEKPARVQALAYTQGQNIHVAPGHEQHLPHEGWHAVQQMQGRVKPTVKAHGVAINESPGLEKEADVMGKKAVQDFVPKATKSGQPAGEEKSQSELNGAHLVQRREQIRAAVGGEEEQPAAAEVVEAQSEGAPATADSMTLQRVYTKDYLAGHFPFKGRITETKLAIGVLAWGYLLEQDEITFEPAIPFFVEQANLNPPTIDHAREQGEFLKLHLPPAELESAQEAIRWLDYDPGNAIAAVYDYVHKYRLMGDRIMAVAHATFTGAGRDSGAAEDAMEAIAPFNYSQDVVDRAENLAAALAQQDITRELEAANREKTDFEKNYQAKVGQPLTTSFNLRTARGKKDVFFEVFKYDDWEYEIADKLDVDSAPKFPDLDGRALQTAMNYVRSTKLEEQNDSVEAVERGRTSKEASHKTDIATKIVPLQGLPDGEAASQWCMTQAGNDKARLERLAGVAGAGLTSGLNLAEAKVLATSLAAIASRNQDDLIVLATGVAAGAPRAVVEALAAIASGAVPAAEVITLARIAGRQPDYLTTLAQGVAAGAPIANVAGLAAAGLGLNQATDVVALAKTPGRDLTYLTPLAEALAGGLAGGRTVADLVEMGDAQQGLASTEVIALLAAPNTLSGAQIGPIAGALRPGRTDVNAVITLINKLHPNFSGAELLEMVTGIVGTTLEKKQIAPLMDAANFSTASRAWITAGFSAAEVGTICGQARLEALTSAELITFLRTANAAARAFTLKAGWGADEIGKTIGYCRTQTGAPTDAQVVLLLERANIAFGTAVVAPMKPLWLRTAAGAATSGAPSWAQVLTHLPTFQAHWLGGPVARNNQPSRTITPAQPPPAQITIALQGERINHVEKGHTFEYHEFSIANITRPGVGYGGTASFVGTGTNVTNALVGVQSACDGLAENAARGVGANQGTVGVYQCGVLPGTSVAWQTWISQCYPTAGTNIRGSDLVAIGRFCGKIA